MRLLITFLCFFCVCIVSSGQKSVDIPDIQIKENRLSVPFSESVRSLEIITKTEIEELPVNSIAELLQYIGGVDVRRRGPNGVQSDINFRGSTFEQVLVLLNGVKIIDPQTGHHVMNLPIDKDIIERIEIVKGPAARTYGQGAFAGAINIVTKNPNQSQGHGEVTIGEFGLWGAKAGINLKKDHVNTYLSLSQEEADPGYQRNNDYRQQGVFLQSEFDIRSQDFLLIASYLSNGFGASSFYAAPDDSTSYEQVNTALINLQSTIKFGKSTLTPSLYFRNNTDDYIFKREQPSFFRNMHRSRVLGTMINGNTRLGKYGTIGYGTEFRNEFLDSNNLGLRERNVFSVNAEYKLYLWEDKIKLVPGVHYNYYSDFGQKLLYGLDGSFSITDEFSIFGNLGTTYRIPSYTELYYEDSKNLGNENLGPESAFNYEAGLKYVSSNIVMQASYFRRDGTNIIDWLETPVLIPEMDTIVYKWRPENITELPIQGFDLSTTIHFAKFKKFSPLRKLRLSYTFIDGEAIQSDLVPSRYALEYIQNQFNIVGYFSLLKIFKCNLAYRYVDRISVENYQVVDFGVGLKLKLIELRLNINNISGEIYEEFPGIPMPGRWMSGSARINF